MTDDDPLAYHRRNKGKIRVDGKVPVETDEDMSLAYTPGVAEPSRAIADDPGAVYEYTAKAEMVGILSDGSAVLGLGDIGPEASIPVMEGKALLIREFADVSAFPLVVDADSPDELLETAERMHPMFGFLMLEDIASPQCFRIEEALKDRLDIPVFHDDQHGAAIAVLAALTNALQVVDKAMEAVSIVIVGAGAAGIATGELLLEAGAGDIQIVDRQGILAPSTEGLNSYQQSLAERVNPEGEEGDLADAMEDADVVIGLSAGGIVSKEMVRSMADDPIVFAMANPDPEIPYHDAREAGAAVVGTGRSDFPNQINNSVAFPGVVKGALQCRAFGINSAMKIAAADAIASLVDPEPERILPSALDPGLHGAVADAVLEAGEETGACRI